MYTEQIDKYLNKIPSPELIQIGQINLRRGIQVYFGLPPESYESEFLTSALAPRAEAISYGNLRKKPESVIQDILEQTQSITHDQFTDASKDEREYLLDRLCNFVQTQQRAVSTSQEVTVQTHGEVDVSMVYTDSQWEGLGSVNFFVHHQSSPESSVPAFIVRGNPLTNQDGTVFQIRDVQPWISENMASVAGIRDGYFGLRKTLNKTQLERVDFLLCERNRIMDILIRNNAIGTTLEGKHVKQEPEEFFLNLGLTYLQRLGFNQFQGIRNSVHPSLTRSKGQNPLKFNYDDLLRTCLPEIGDDPVHPWELNCGNNRNYIYLPHLNRLPPALVKIMMAI